MGLRMLKLVKSAMRLRRKYIPFISCICFIAVTWWFVNPHLKQQSTTHVLPASKSQTTYPRILHQIWLGYTSHPPKWERAIKSCVDLNVEHGYTYILWSLRDIQELIAKQHPGFIYIFNAYPHPIQQVDAARYIILYHFGGVYLDMDIFCELAFDDLFTENLQKSDAILPQTNSFIVSNDFMAAKKNSAFMEHLVSNLAAYNGWYVLPYLTVMLTTGPLFVTRCLGNYPHPELVYRLPKDDYTSRWFTHIDGSTWHEVDGVIFWGVYVYRFYITFILCVVAVIVILHCNKQKRIKR